jgi:hypothetical protein
VADKIGGLVMRVEGALVFLSSEVAGQVAPLPQITRLPGAPEELLGIALHKDELVPVIAIGSARDSMVICSHVGEHLALVGGVIVSAGLFEAQGPTTVSVGGERAEAFDIAGLYEKVQTGRWKGGWGG